MAALAWVEVLDRRGHVHARHRVDAAPAIIGRGYGSDVLLDDPWLSPVHARIFRELDGSLAVEDARSENGTWSADGARVTTLPIGRGVTLRIGRTLVRVVPADAPVAATLGADVAAPRERGWRHRWVGPGFALCAGAAYAWMQLLSDGEVHRSAALVGDGLTMTGGLVLWAGIWALISRAVAHRAQFLTHLAVAGAGALALLAVVIGTQYAAFLAPGEPAFEGVVALVGVVVLAAMLFGHLMLASALPAPRALAISVAVTFGLFALGAIAESDSGTSDDQSTPDFSGVLKPLAPGAIPTQRDSVFFAQFDSLKVTVDSLASDDQ